MITKLIYLLSIIFLVSCSTGNEPLMTRGESEFYCGNLHSNSSSYSICVRQLMLPKKYVENCFRKKITPGTNEFNDCGRNNLLQYPDNNSSKKEKELQDEIRQLKLKQQFKDIQEGNKVVK